MTNWKCTDALPKAQKVTLVVKLYGLSLIPSTSTVQASNIAVSFIRLLVTVFRISYAAIRLGGCLDPSLHLFCIVCF